VNYLLAAFLGVVHGYFCASFDTFRDIFSRILGGFVAQTVSLLGAVRSLNTDCLTRAVDAGDFASGAFKPSFPMLSTSLAVFAVPLAV
jgi:hypothetical protein